MGENKTDKMIREKLQSFAPDTPEDLWSSINDRLDGQARRKRALWWKYSSIAAAVVLAFGTGYFFNAYQSEELQIPLPMEKTIPPKEKKSAGKSDQAAASQKQTAPTSIRQDEKSVPAKEKSKPSPGQKQSRDNSPGGAVPEKALLHGKRLTPVSALVNQERENDKPASSADEIISTPPPAARGSQEMLRQNFLASTTDTDEEALSSPKITIEEIETNRRAPSAFRLMAAGGPAVGISQVNQLEENQALQNNVENEEVTASFAAGLKLHYRLSGKWEINTGLMVNRWEQQGENIALQREQTSTTNASSTASGITSTASFDVKVNAYNTTESLGNADLQLRPDINYRYTYLVVPLGAAYYLLDKTWKLKLQAGVNMRMLSDSELQLQYPDGHREDLNARDLSRINWQLMLGPSLAYKLSSQWQFHLEPSFYYGISPVENLPQLNTYHHQLMMFSGISYSFK